ncbi:MAG: DUF975 family protein [Firmicutes bacterium]|nr:DUF975 family protein [Bacillota bacterium]
MKVTLSCGKIKKISRQMFRGQWAACFLAVFIQWALVQIPQILAFYLTKSQVITTFLNIYTVVITGPMTLGLAAHFLDTFRRQQEPMLGSFARGISDFLSGVLLFLIAGIQIFLWSLLFLVPGILAAIRYSQAFYVLAEEPHLNPLECIRRSKEMMRQNMGKFFLLELSFLPWYILSVLPTALAMSSRIDPSAVYTAEDLLRMSELASMDPVITVLKIIPLIVTVYLHAANACFYDLVSGNLAVESGGVPYGGYIGESVDRYEITGFESEKKEDER